MSQRPDLPPANGPLARGEAVAPAAQPARAAGPAATAGARDHGLGDDVTHFGYQTVRAEEKAGKVAEVRTACLYEKSHSVVKCDYVWKKTDMWINFPWSDKDPVAKRSWSVKDA